MRLRICREERTGGLLSAGSIHKDIGVFTECGYNLYELRSCGKRIMIGGVPDGAEQSYINNAAAADAIVLLTSNPEFAGGMDRILKINPDIEVYASSAGLRNIKAIVNRTVNEKLIKNSTELCRMKFIITPYMQWVDSVMAEYDGILFSGEAFSGFDGTSAGLKKWFDARLAVNKQFVRSAVSQLEGRGIRVICPVYGGICSDAAMRPNELFDEYKKWAEEPERDYTAAVVVYASRYGYTESLARRAAAALSGSCRVTLIDAENTDPKAAAEIINGSDILAVGTHTINRSAPRSIWDIITRLDVVNRRGRPYFVFGSFGWAGEGTKFVSRTLSAMGFCEASKPVEVLFRPEDRDYTAIEKAAERMISYENKNRRDR